LHLASYARARAAVAFCTVFCREALPPNTHPIYVVRLQLIWTIVQSAAREHEAHWMNRLAAAERAVDAELAQRERR